MPSNLGSALCLAAALSILSFPALAQNDDRFVNDVDSKQKAACTPDVQRLCNDYIPDVDAIVACLNRQRASLSPACADVFGVPLACKTDIRLLCADAVIPGLVACLKDQRASLSAGCATAFAETEPPALPPPTAKPAKKKAAEKKKAADSPTSVK